MEQSQPMLNLKEIVLNGMSFEKSAVLNGVPVEQGNLVFDYRIGYDLLESTPQGDIYRVSLLGTAEFKEQEKTRMLAEAEYNVVATLGNMTEEQVGAVIHIDITRMMEPYIQQTINDMLVKSGMQPVRFLPFNFFAQYQQHLADKQNQAS